MKRIFNRAAFFVVTSFVVAGVILFARSDAKVWELMSGFLFDSVVVSLVVSAAYIIGIFIKRKIGDEGAGLEGFLTAIGLGLGADILILFALGTFGLLYRSLIMVMIGLPLILKTREIKRFVESKPWSREFREIRLGAIEFCAIAILFVLGGFVFLSALQPEVFYDALYYHNAFPLLYLIRHKIEIYPYAVHSAMPSNICLLYAMPLSFAEAGSVRLTHILFFVGSVLWIYSLGKRLFGAEAASVGGVIWATIPGVHWMAGHGANDMGVCFFGLGAVSLLLRWVFQKEGRATLIVSAILLGIAVGSKYSALMIGVICAVGIVAGALKRKPELGLRGAAMAVVVYGIASIGVGAPWYARNAILLKNPLYPAFSKSGSAGDFASRNLKKDSQPLYPISQTFTKLPADLWTGKGKFGAGEALGLGVIVFAPAILWGFWRRGAACWIGAGSLLFYLLWSRSILILRYFYPGLALCSVLAGGMLAAGEKNKMTRKAAVVVFLSATAFFGFRATMTYFESSPIGAIRSFVSRDSNEKLLLKYVPHYAPAKFVRENLPPNAYLLFVGETQGYYFHCNYLPVSFYDRHPLEEWVKTARSPEELRAIIKSEGFTHILLCDHEWKIMNRSYGTLTLDENGRKLFDTMISGLKPVYADAFYGVYAL